MKVVVGGGRRFSERLWFFHFLDAFEPAITALAHGDYTGADALAKAWAIDRGIPHTPFPANWARYGPSAGPRRNTQMLLDFQPGFVITFPGNDGTADLVRQAEYYKIPVVRPNFQEFLRLLETS